MLVVDRYVLLFGDLRLTAIFLEHYVSTVSGIGQAKLSFARQVEGGDCPSPSMDIDFQ